MNAKRHLRLRGCRPVFSLLGMFACLLGAHGAQAACSSPAAASGSYYYNSTDKNIYLCTGSSWAVNSAGQDISNTPQFLHGYPRVGPAGGNVFTLCNVPLGQRCGGGFYGGDGNLVIAPAGCSGTTCPSVMIAGVAQPPIGGQDVTTRQYRTSTNRSNVVGSRRFGYQISVDNNNSDHPAFQFCRGLSVAYGGVTYNDWYLPTTFEAEMFAQVMPEIGGSIVTSNLDINYWSADENKAGDRAHVVKVLSYLPRIGSNQAGQGNSGPSQKTDNGPVRCVRRN